MEDEYRPQEASVRAILSNPALAADSPPFEVHPQIHALSKFRSGAAQKKGRIRVNKEVLVLLKQVSQELDAAQRHYIAWQQFGAAGESILKLSPEIFALPGDGGATASEAAIEDDDAAAAATAAGAGGAAGGAAGSSGGGSTDLLIGHRRWGHFPLLGRLRAVSAKPRKSQLQQPAQPTAADAAAAAATVAAAAAAAAQDAGVGHDGGDDWDVPDSPKANWMEVMRQKKRAKEQSIVHMLRLKHAVLVIQRAWRAHRQRKASRALAMMMLRAKVRRAHRAAYVSNLLRRKTPGTSSSSGAAGEGDAAAVGAAAGAADADEDGKDVELSGQEEAELGQALQQVLDEGTLSMADVAELQLTDLLTRVRAAGPGIGSGSLGGSSVTLSGMRGSSSGSERDDDDEAVQESGWKMLAKPTAPKRALGLRVDTEMGGATWRDSLRTPGGSRLGAATPSHRIGTPDLNLAAQHGAGNGSGGAGSPQGSGGSSPMTPGLVAAGTPGSPKRSSLASRGSSRGGVRVGRAVSVVLATADNAVAVARSDGGVVVRAKSAARQMQRASSRFNTAPPAGVVAAGGGTAVAAGGCDSNSREATTTAAAAAAAAQEFGAAAAAAGALDGVQGQAGSDSAGGSRLATPQQHSRLSRGSTPAGLPASGFMPGAAADEQSGAQLDLLTLADDAGASWMPDAGGGAAAGVQVLSAEQQQQLWDQQQQLWEQQQAVMLGRLQQLQPTADPGTDQWQEQVQALQQGQREFVVQLQQHLQQQLCAAAGCAAGQHACREQQDSTGTYEGQTADGQQQQQQQQHEALLQALQLGQLPLGAADAVGALLSTAAAAAAAAGLPVSPHEFAAAAISVAAAAAASSLRASPSPTQGHSSRSPSPCQQQQQGQQAAGGVSTGRRSCSPGSSRRATGHGEHHEPWAGAASRGSSPGGGASWTEAAAAGAGEPGSGASRRGTRDGGGRGSRCEERPPSRGFCPVASSGGAFGRYERGLGDGLQQDYRVLTADALLAAGRTSPAAAAARSHRASTPGGDGGTDSSSGQQAAHHRRTTTQHDQQQQQREEAAAALVHDAGVAGGGAAASPGRRQVVGHHQHQQGQQQRQQQKGQAELLSMDDSTGSGGLGLVGQASAAGGSSNPHLLSPAAVAARAAAAAEQGLWMMNGFVCCDPSTAAAAAAAAAAASGRGSHMQGVCVMPGLNGCLGQQQQQCRADAWFERLQRSHQPKANRQQLWDLQGGPGSGNPHQQGHQGCAGNSHQSGSPGPQGETELPQGRWGRRAAVKNAWLFIDGRTASSLPWQALAAAAAAGQAGGAGVAAADDDDASDAAVAAVFKGPGSGLEQLSIKGKRLLLRCMWIKSAAGVMRRLGRDAGFLENKMLALLKQQMAPAGAQLLLWSVTDEQQQQQALQQQLLMNAYLAAVSGSTGSGGSCSSACLAALEAAGLSYQRQAAAGMPGAASRLLQQQSVSPAAAVRLGQNLPLLPAARSRALTSKPVNQQQLLLQQQLLQHFLVQQQQQQQQVLALGQEQQAAAASSWAPEAGSGPQLLWLQQQPSLAAFQQQQQWLQQDARFQAQLPICSRIVLAKREAPPLSPAPAARQANTGQLQGTRPGRSSCAAADGSASQPPPGADTAGSLAVTTSGMAGRADQSGRSLSPPPALTIGTLQAPQAAAPARRFAPTRLPVQQAWVEQQQEQQQQRHQSPPRHRPAVSTRQQQQQQQRDLATVSMPFYPVAAVAAAPRPRSEGSAVGQAHQPPQQPTVADDTRVLRQQAAQALLAAGQEATEPMFVSFVASNRHQQRFRSKPQQRRTVDNSCCAASAAASSLADDGTSAAVSGLAASLLRSSGQQLGKQPGLLQHLRPGIGTPAAAPAAQVAGVHKQQQQQLPAAVLLQSQASLVSLALAASKLHQPPMAHTASQLWQPVAEGAAGGGKAECSAHGSKASVSVSQQQLPQLAVLRVAADPTGGGAAAAAAGHRAAGKAAHAAGDSMSRHRGQSLPALLVVTAAACEAASSKRPDGGSAGLAN